MVAHDLSIQWAIVLVLSLYPQLATSAPTPTRSRAGPTLVVKRNAAAVPTSATGVTQLLPQSQLDPSATSTLASSASPAQTSNTGNFGYGTFFGSGLPSNFLTWISIVVVVGIVVALLIARFFYIRRFYPVTPRNYFIPPRGIHINWLKIHIKGPPPRRSSPPTYGIAVIEGRRARARRDRTTRGETIGEGGARRGQRDVDDEFDGDGTPGVAGAAGDELPMYELDSSLPAYVAPTGAEVEAVAARSAAAREREGGRAVESDTSNGGPAPDAEGTDVTSGGILAAGVNASDPEDEQLPSVQDYEQQTRAARDAAVAAPNAPASATASPSTTTFGISRPALLARLSSRASAATTGSVTADQAINSSSRPAAMPRSVSHPRARPLPPPVPEAASTRSMSSTSSTSGASTSGVTKIEKPATREANGDDDDDDDEIRRKQDDEVDLNEEDGESGQDAGQQAQTEMQERTRTPPPPPSHPLQ